MGFFDHFRKPKHHEPDTSFENITIRAEIVETPKTPICINFPEPIPGDPASQPIPESEKQYYQEDRYYTSALSDGLITLFSERKKTSYPSKNGLYVPEILMLSFCKKYPNPKDGYPGHWWYEYGIRNVGAVYQSLEERGFLEIGPKGKYQLTEKGQNEVDENEYVPYMHNTKSYSDYTVWDINRMIHEDDSKDYVAILKERRKQAEEERIRKRKEHFEYLKTLDPKTFDLSMAQDYQIGLVNEKLEEYEKTNDIDSYIAFWEDLWKNGGLIFNGSMWTFELADLYIKNNRLDDALTFVKWLKDNSQYSDKAERYITKIENKKIKQLKKTE